MNIWLDALTIWQFYIGKSEGKSKARSWRRRRQIRW